MHLDHKISKLQQVHQASASSLSGQQVVPGPGEDPLAEDGLRAGVIYGPNLAVTHPEIIKRCSRLFFSIHHESICTVFESELRQLGRRYRK